MSKLPACVCAVAALAAGLRAEVHSMNLKQAVEQAIRENPDIIMSRFEEEKAKQSVRNTRDPFAPRITVGSGLAYTSGFPMSIEGSAPSIVQATAVQYLF